MINYVIINGVNSNTIQGLKINIMPPITKPMIRTQTEEIDGRDGDLITELGYSSYDKQMEIGLWGTYDINAIIKYFTGEGKIIFSTEPDKYYYFKILDQIDYEKLLKFKKATITFHCQPYKYPVEETPLVETYEYIEETGTDISINTEESSMKISPYGNTYQNGTPTPDTPIPVQVVSGDNTIEICGKNRFAYGITAIDKTTTYRPNASQRLTLTAGNNVNEVKFNYGSGSYCTGYFELENINGTLDYTISFNVKENTTQFTPSVIIDTTNSTTDKLVVQVSGANGSTRVTTSDYFVLNNIQIEKGNQATTYEPYTSQTYPISLGNIELCKIGDYQDKIAKSTGNNLFDYKTPNINQITWTPTDNGGEFTSSTYWKNLGNKLELDTTKQYTFSFGARNSDKLYYYIKTYTDETYQRVKTTIVNDGTALSKTFTPDSKYVSIYFANGGNLQNVEIPNIQLEESSTKTEFEPYLPKGTWYLNKQIGKVVLNGSENWSINGTGTSNWFYNTNGISNGSETESIRSLLKSNNYSYSQVFSSNTNQGIWYSKTSIRIRYGTEDTINNFKTWLSTHNTIVYYVLATPTYTEITDSTLLGQLVDLEEAYSYSPQTNISQVNNDLPFELDVIAMSAGSGILEINNIGTAYAMPTIALEGTGNVSITLNDEQVLQVDMTTKNEITIDSENMDAYAPDGTLANRLITGDYNNLKLSSGTNTMKFGGDFTKATVTDYTRWI